jgi:aminomethyltransferase
MDSNQDLKRTPLFESHVALGAKMVPFAGWEMPVQYAGVIAEHRAVRSAVGLFDVSHMGEILIEGEGAFELLDLLTCNDLRKLQVGRAQYSAFTTPSGGIVDDIIIYKYSDTKYFICVNASNSDRDYAWIQEHNQRQVEVKNLSSEYAQIAVQGPKAIELLTLLPGLASVAELRPFSFCDLSSDWGTVTIARTGYTGEDGAEIFVTPKQASDLWRALLEIGSQLGVQPIGLGARDTLRLEACLPLHGHELSEQITAIESGLSWIVKPQKGDFLGRTILEQQQKQGAPRNLIGLFLDQPGIARQDDKVLTTEDKEIGYITSGTRTPTVDKALGLALVDSSVSTVGTPLHVNVRGKSIAAHIVDRPFYRRAKSV